MNANQSVILTSDIRNSLRDCLSAFNTDWIGLLVDSNTRNKCLPLIGEILPDNITIIDISAGEQNKTLDTVVRVWGELSDADFTRNSLLICLGGGVVCDLGGFAASTFKRGIRRINIPTTLLADVDASVGGKTAIDFRGIKNEIGLFSNPDFVIISPEFLHTLPKREILSGYGEILKHSLLDCDKSLIRACDLELGNISQYTMLEVIRHSVEFKASVVASDPYDNGLRHILNLGHTAGHAFESFAISHGHDITHGVAVAYGLSIAVILSRLHSGFSADKMYMIVRHIREIFGVMPLTCEDYPEILQLMRKDKKNRDGKITFVLLEDVGIPRINIPIGEDEIESAIDIYRDICS